MSFTPKFETSSASETSERQLDSAEQWKNGIELPDDSEDWQNSIKLPEDMDAQSTSSIEKKEKDLSRFEESRQVEQMVDYLNDMPEIKRENWLNLSFEERVKVAQKIETQAAKVGCRPALSVETASLGKNEFGYTDWKSQKIVLNETLLQSNKAEDFRQALKTLLHEGRHGFQFSNLTLERTEPNDEKYRSWVANWAMGYLSAKLFGMKNYYLQPMEVDARVFSEAIVSKIKD